MRTAARLVRAERCRVTNAGKDLAVVGTVESGWYCPQRTALWVAPPPGAGQAGPSCHLTMPLIFRDFTFPPLKREGSCYHI